MRNLLHIQVLTALANGDSNGYGVIVQLQHDGVMAASVDPRHIYRVLKRLADEGVVEVRELNGASVYHLTSAGRNKLRFMQGEVRQLLAHLHERL